MKLLYAREAKVLIRHLSPAAKRGIQQTIENLQSNPYQGKTLQKELTGYCSIPFKHYRIIYKVMEDEKRIMIYSIGPRRNIYEEFVRFMTSASRKSMQ